MNFECIFCETVILCVPGRTNNILTHLRNYCTNINQSQIDKLKKWLVAFDKSNKEPHNKFKLTSELLKLIKFFVSSNMSTSCFDNPHFRDLFSGYKMEIPCAKTFSTTILSDVFEKVMISKWDRMHVPPKFRALCTNLINAFNHKFNYEINSPVYQVACLLNVKKLKIWFDREDCQVLKRNGIDKMIDVANNFLSSKHKRSQSFASDISNTPSTQSSIDSMIGMLEDNDYLDKNEHSNII